MHNRVIKLANITPGSAELFEKKSAISRDPSSNF